MVVNVHPFDIAPLVRKWRCSIGHLTSGLSLSPLIIPSFLKNSNLLLLETWPPLPFLAPHCSVSTQILLRIRHSLVLLSPSTFTMNCCRYATFRLCWMLVSSTASTWNCATREYDIDDGSLSMAHLRWLHSNTHFRWLTFNDSISVLNSICYLPDGQPSLRQNRSTKKSLLFMSYIPSADAILCGIQIL
jgi:hypothetical protein